MAAVCVEVVVEGPVGETLFLKVTSDAGELRLDLKFLNLWLVVVHFHHIFLSDHLINIHVVDTIVSS